MQWGTGWLTLLPMKYQTLAMQMLAGGALLGIGFGFGRWERDREAGLPEVSGTMKPVLPAGASPVAKPAARGAIRESVPGSPFAEGEAEAWLLGLRGKGMDATRALGALDAVAAKEVLATIVAIYERLLKEDGDTAELWKSEGDIELLRWGWDVTLGTLAAQDPESAVAAVNDLGKEGESQALMVWAEIARHAPERLEALLATVVPELLPDAVLGAVSVLLDSDVEAGIALMMKYPGEEFDSLRGDVVEYLVELDPRRALALAATLAGDGQGTEHLCEAIDDWLKEDEVAARQWVEEHGGPGRDHARTRLLIHDASRDPEAAVAQFAALRNEGVPDEVLERAVWAMVQALGKTDPGAARAWMDTLPEGTLRDDAVSGLARIWVDQDPTAASEWIATLPPGGQRDAGAWHLVEAIQKRDPASALEWARNISEENTRERMIGQVLEEWRGQDPDSAKAAALGLPEEDRPAAER